MRICEHRCCGMELATGSVALSCSINESFSYRRSAETKVAKGARSCSVSRVSVSANRPLSVGQQACRLQGTNIMRELRSLPPDKLGLGCELCSKDSKRTSSAQGSRWQPSAAAEASTAGVEDVDISLRGSPSSTHTTVHVVREGDTLTALSKQYKTTVRKIALSNDIEDVDSLQTGEEIVIPVQLGARHKGTPPNRDNDVHSVADRTLQEGSFRSRIQVPSTAAGVGGNTTTTVSSPAPVHRNWPFGSLVKVTLPLLLIAPIVGFCIRCMVDYFHECINKEVGSKYAEMETYHARHRPKVKRWQGILDEDREEVSDLVRATAALDSVDASRPSIDQLTPSGYAVMKSTSEELLPDDTVGFSSTQTQDFEEIRKSYAELESTYVKFLSDSGLSRGGYWRGAIPQLQEDL